MNFDPMQPRVPIGAEVATVDATTGDQVEDINRLRGLERDLRRRDLKERRRAVFKLLA